MEIGSAPYALARAPGPKKAARSSSDVPNLNASASLNLASTSPLHPSRASIERKTLSAPNHLCLRVN
ncbi:uncharacterized protein CLUP02_14605 [Colletotrichum lupini]|uniref:Uncharacterized protein n=1 Tax=Colletotrichum lupini TaxID=145971 RepID=A0A9Q8WN85_9PEZI|nr:uncharacterized protein CLUP02_14605 [Colletotrichum lupini]UQC89077.1 hypothetical protein CLUP02_14605 [Colletotrichum lupini]